MNKLDDGAVFIKMGDAAKLLNLSRTTIYNLAARGEIPVRRFGRSIRIPRRAIEQLVADAMARGDER
jgi:excisionase family DNA binding protein